MFLDAFELSQIKHDFRDAVRSHAGIDIEIHYKIPVAPAVVNEAYGVTEAAVWKDKIEEIRGIQKIVNVKNLEILRWGFLEVGDCVFYIEEEIDLSHIDFDNADVVAGGVHWTPLGKKMDEFKKYMAVLMSRVQICQVIACKLKLN